jgi:hypothetical protein
MPGIARAPIPASRPTTPPSAPPVAAPVSKSSSVFVPVASLISLTSSWFSPITEISSGALDVLIHLPPGSPHVPYRKLLLGAFHVQTLTLKFLLWTSSPLLSTRLEENETFPVVEICLSGNNRKN